MSPTTDHRLPLTVVTGFLGSGKTTLIRHLLSDPRAAHAAVIVNEFGEIGIDHHLFRKTEERITLLRDGCACCARRDDLIVALKALLRRVDAEESPQVDRVILETTGLADPAPILHTIVADPVLSRRYRVARTIATLDAVSGAANLERYGEAMRQIAAADAVVLTKGDLATADALQTLSSRVVAVNPAAFILTAEHGHIDPAILFEDDVVPATARDRNDAVGIATSPLHTQPGGVASLTLTFAEPLDWRLLGLWLTMLLHRHGERILRVKGLLDTGDEGPLLLEGVQHVVHAPRHLPTWPDDDRRTRLVFILRELDPARVRQSLASFRRLGGTG